MKSWWTNLSRKHQLWIVLSVVLIALLGIISGDTPVNIAIGVIGMAYVGVYATGTRWNFLLGVAYVGIYTVICLENRIMLDAIQNIILIPMYIYSFIYWGKYNIKPRNISRRNSILILSSAVIVFFALFGLSRLLNGNYSMLDALNTTCTLYAMVLGIFGCSICWILWTVNNAVSAFTFGLCLFTPTGSMAVFAMKCIFLINGLIGWYTFTKIGRTEAIKDDLP